MVNGTWPCSVFVLVERDTTICASTRLHAPRFDHLRYLLPVTVPVHALWVPCPVFVEEEAPTAVQVTKCPACVGVCVSGVVVS